MRCSAGVGDGLGDQALHHAGVVLDGDGVVEVADMVFIIRFSVAFTTPPKST